MITLFSLKQESKNDIFLIAGDKRIRTSSDWVPAVALEIWKCKTTNKKHEKKSTTTDRFGKMKRKK